KEVPVERRSATSLRAVEKTGESAITAAPHTTSSTITTGQGLSTSIGESRQHRPLRIIAYPAARPRPSPLDAQPPRRHPNPPAIPIVTKVIRPTAASSAGLIASKNIGSHVHSAYSSHICPKYPRLASRGPSSLNISIA